MFKLRSLLARIFKPSKTALRSLVKLLFFLAGIIALLLLAAGFWTPIFDSIAAYNLVWELGSYRISLKLVIKSLIVCVLLFGVAKIGGRFCELQIKKLKKSGEANKVLYTKVSQFLIYALCSIIAFDMLGINLKSLAWFSGAVGIGIGLSLKGTMGNFISGAMLLFEKTLRYNDIIELIDGTIGFLRNTGIRCTRLETFDGKEVLIPNEDLISQRVNHWTFSNNKLRIDLLIPVGLESDFSLVSVLILQVINENNGCLKDPAPSCFLKEITPYAANFLVYFWLENVALSYWQPRHEVLLGIWQSFNQHEIRGWPKPCLFALACTAAKMPNSLKPS